MKRTLPKVIQKLEDLIPKLKSITRKILRSEMVKLQRSDVLLVCHDNDRGLTVEGKAYSPLLDTIHEELVDHGLVCQAIALPWSSLGYHETCGRAIIISRNHFLYKLYNNITSRIGLRSLNIYDSIIRKAQPKVIIGIGLPADLCISAKRNRVLDVELLHGMGYSQIPTQWQTSVDEAVPSCVLTLDPKSEKAMKSLQSRGAKVRQIPHPFMRRFLSRLTACPVEWGYSFDRRDYKKVILVSLQWGYAGDHGVYHCFEGILSNGLFYEELEALIEKRRDVFWKFRLHPVQLRGANKGYAAAFMRNFSSKHTNVSWELPSSLPLPVIARAADGHVTMCSMSCYEVAAFGLQSLVLCPTTRDDGPFSDYFDDLVNEGYATKHAFDVDFVERWVDRLTPMKARVWGDECEANWNHFIMTIKGLSLD